MRPALAEEFGRALVQAQVEAGDEVGLEATHETTHEAAGAGAPGRAPGPGRVGAGVLPRITLRVSGAWAVTAQAVSPGASPDASPGAPGAASSGAGAGDWVFHVPPPGVAITGDVASTPGWYVLVLRAAVGSFELSAPVWWGPRQRTPQLGRARGGEAVGAPDGTVRVRISLRRPV